MKINQTIVMLFLFICNCTCWATTHVQNNHDTIDNVELNSSLLNIIDDFSDNIDSLFVLIVKNNPENTIDYQTYRQKCSWLIEFKENGNNDTIWIHLSIINPLIKLVAKENLSYPNNILSRIEAKSVSRDGTSVYITTKNRTNELFTQTGKSVFHVTDSSYFENHITVGLFYYTNNTISTMLFHIENDVD